MVSNATCLFQDGWTSGKMCSAFAESDAFEALQQRAPHHAGGRVKTIEQPKCQLALIYQHPRAVGVTSSERDRRSEKRRWLRAIDGVVKETTARRRFISETREGARRQTHRRRIDHDGGDGEYRGISQSLEACR